MEIENNNMDRYTIVQDHSHKTSSCVWKYFGSLKKNEELIDLKHVYCTKCFEETKTKKYQKSTSTGNLIKHLKKAHNIMDQPSYRIKQEKNRIIVTKEEAYYDEEPDTDYLFDGSGNANYMPLPPSQQGGLHTITKQENEPETNEYLVHDINEILINEIAKRPQIYDSSLCTKNKTQIRRDLWLEIYEALNHLIPYEKLPKIWKNIRDRYQKIKKDLDKYGRNAKPKYRYYDMLGFLDEVDCCPTANSNNEKMNVPIENFVENFIFLNEHEGHENVEMNHLDSVSIQQLSTAKDDLFMESKIKKIKLDTDDIANQNPPPQETIMSLSPSRNTMPKEHLTDNEATVPLLSSSSQIQEHQQQPQQQQIQHQLQSPQRVILPPPAQPQVSPTIVAAPETSSNIAVTSAWCTNTNSVSTSTPKTKQTEEFIIFGSYVAEVMKNMDKHKARLLQMKVMELINEYDDITN